MTHDQFEDEPVTGLLSAITAVLCTDKKVRGHHLLGELTPTEIALFVVANVAEERLQSVGGIDDDALGHYLCSVTAGALVTAHTTDLEAGKEAMELLYTCMLAAMDQLNDKMDAEDAARGVSMPAEDESLGAYINRYIHEAPTTKQ